MYLKKSFRTFALILFISISLYSCTETIDLKEFNSKAWIEDKKGCASKRSELAETLYAQRDTLLGKKQAAIEQLLGKPDRTDLDKRWRKTFYYFYEPSQLCDSSITESKAIAIEFESLNRVRFVSKATF